MKPRILNFTEAELREIVAKSTNMREVVKALGYVPTGNNNRTVRNYLEKYKISIDHFTFVARTQIKRSVDNIFIANSSASQSTVRKWYLKGNYTEYKCSVCGQEPIWNGRPLVLTLDHINGIRTDHRLENLRWICPNCDRQSDTYGFKNKKNIEYFLQNTQSVNAALSAAYMEPLITPQQSKQNFCTNCGKPISANAIRCKTCLNIYMKNKSKCPNKDLLIYHIQITQGNLSAISRNFDVSCNTVKKWCNKYFLNDFVKSFKQVKEPIKILEKDLYVIQQIDSKTLNIINTFTSCSAAESALGISHVADVCNGKRKLAGGFIWKRIKIN